jgi:CubicO group peptidase (beta-lactamase class C family)
MKPRHIVLASIAILFTAPAVFAQERAVAAKIDRIVRQQMLANKIPGVSVAILRAGKIILLKSYGLANVELQVPVKPETVFQSGSIGKQFTAAAVMILVQEKKLSLADKLSKYFPDAPAAWKDITVWHLLTHTSGLGDYPADIDLRRDYTEEEYYESFKKAPLDFAPGSSWNYSNVGYVMLGILIRKVSGQFYGDFLQQRIFKPAGMTTARVISEADIVPNRAAGYRLVQGELKNQQWVSPSTNSTADGSLYVSILDLAKWDTALYTDRLFTRGSLDQIWTPAKLSDGTTKDYGFGWHLGVLHGQRVVFHGGAWQGFKSQIVRFLDAKLTIIFLANSWETREFKLARELAASFYPEFALPDVKTIQDTEPKTTLLVRRTLMQMVLRKADPRLNSLSLPVAIINSSELVDRQNEDGLRVYRYLLTDIGRSLVCTVKLTTADKIAALDIAEL